MMLSAILTNNGKLLIYLLERWRDAHVHIHQTINSLVTNFPLYCKLCFIVCFWLRQKSLFSRKMTSSLFYQHYSLNRYFNAIVFLGNSLIKKCYPNLKYETEELNSLSIFTCIQSINLVFNDISKSFQSIMSIIRRVYHCTW